MRRIKERNYLWLFGVFSFFAVLLGFFTIPVSYAQDSYWIGGTGSWFDGSNWDPYGVPPTIYSNVFLTSSDGINRTVYYDSNIATTASLLIDATGTGTMTLNVSDGALYLPNGLLQIGDKGSGKLIISGGAAGGDVRVGSNGIVDLYRGYFVGINQSNLSVSGIVNQMGGESIWDGAGVRSGGQYNISGGSFNSGPSWGIDANGVVNQSGGIVCDNLQVWGTYNLSGGTHQGGYLHIENIGTFNQTGGINNISVGSNAGTFNLSGGTFGLYEVDPYNIFYNSGTFNYSGGNIGSNTAFNNSGTVNLLGAGTRVVDGNVVNSGTWKTTHTTAAYNGTFTNNGVYISDPATQYFKDLIIGQTGYLVGQYKDYFYINGNFVNHSTMNTDWNTMHSYLSFISGEDILHDFYLTGVDYGAAMSGYSDNFSWGTLDITGNVLYLYDGNDVAGAALYLREILGLNISGTLITNIFGMDGLNIYYMANLKENDYLGGLVYDLSGGGHLAPVPEPSTMLLLGSGLVGLIGFRRFKK